MTKLETTSIVSGDELCFVCGDCLKGNGQKLIETYTGSLGTPLATKLGDIIGDRFLVVVSRFDEVCERCLLLFRRMEELERDLLDVKESVVALVKLRYGISFDREEEAGGRPPKATLAGDSSPALTNSPQFEDIGASERCLPQEEKFLVGNLENVVDPVQDLSECTEVNYLESFKENVEVKENDCIERMEKIEDETNCRKCDISFDSDYERDFSLKICPDNLCAIGGDAKADLWIPVDDLQLKDCDSLLKSDSSSNLIYKCSMCDFKDEKIEVVGAHFQVHSEKGKAVGHVCAVCEMPFVSASILARHSRVHDQSKGPVECTVCGLLCHDSLHLSYHHKNEHGGKVFECVLCQLKFESRKDLKNHLLSAHPDDKNFTCDKCGAVFKRHNQFENHRLYAHGNQKCRFCEKHISDAVKLRQHENRHARIDSKKFECEECGRTFKSPGGLRVHKVSHTGDYKFYCEFCGRGFVSGVVLEEHKGVHTREERYVCDTCGRKFVLYSTFHLHKQWHDNPYPFPCSLCGRKFRYRSERSNHVRKCHTGEYPHKCAHCPATFLRSTYLKRHMSMHTKQYPHNCKLCAKGFDQRRSLARHLARVHKDDSLIDLQPKKCQYKVALRPDEYPRPAS